MSAIPSAEKARRIRAAREYAGLRSPELLSEAIGEEGLGVRTMRNIENGRRAVHNRELRSIAATTGVPYEWFTVPDLAEAVRLGAGLVEEDGPAASREATANAMAKRSAEAAARREQQRRDTGTSSDDGRDRPREAE